MHILSSGNARLGNKPLLTCAFNTFILKVRIVFSGNWLFTAASVGVFLIQEKEKHDVSTYTQGRGVNTHRRWCEDNRLDTPGTQKIGIVAPRDVPVHRSEVYYKIKQGDKDGNR